MPFTRLLVFFLLLLSLCAQTPADLDTWVENTRKQFDIPGIAVAIVKDGQVVTTKGYGIRKLGNPALVDEHTLFGIASNTKAFTTAALAILIDEGKLNWDDKVTQHLPGFSLQDPYVTRDLTVRDLVSHRSGLGLGAGDLMFWPNTTFTRDQVLAGARSIRPASSFRSSYAYNNLMFVVAGEVIHKVSGLSYDDYIRARIFAPLEMTEAQISNNGIGESDNSAVPHSRGWRLEGSLKPISWTRDDVWAAAAGVKANVTDLAKWMRVQLAQGQISEAKRLFSQRASRQMWSAQTVINVGTQPKALAGQQSQFAAYGLGWFLKDYRGHKLAYHGGGLTGMVTQTTLVPGLNLGIAVLTNQEEPGAFQAITNHILDYYMKAAAPDWTAAIYENASVSRKRRNEREQKAIAARAKDTKPSLPLGEYAQDYRDPWYGLASIELKPKGLYVRMQATPDMKGRLEHWHHNTFAARWDDPVIPDAYFNFQLDNQGRIELLKMEAISDLADFSFDYHDLEFRPVPRKN